MHADSAQGFVLLRVPDRFDVTRGDSNSHQIIQKSADTFPWHLKTLQFSYQKILHRFEWGAISTLNLTQI